MTEYSDEVDAKTKALIDKDKDENKTAMEGAMAASGVLEYYKKVENG